MLLVVIYNQLLAKKPQPHCVHYIESHIKHYIAIYIYNDKQKAMSMLFLWGVQFNYDHMMV